MYTLGRRGPQAGGGGAAADSDRGEMRGQDGMRLGDMVGSHGARCPDLVTQMAVHQLDTGSPSVSQCGRPLGEFGGVIN